MIESRVVIGGTLAAFSGILLVFGLQMNSADLRTEAKCKGFAEYCRTRTDSELVTAYWRQKRNKHKDYVAIAKAEADRRGVSVSLLLPEDQA